jgi:diaminopimelate decarboxylase
MTGFHWQNNQLFAEDIALTEIASRFGTPCFVYSRAAIMANYRAYADALASVPHMICYAVKANSNLGVLNVLAKLGAGFDIVSGGELVRVLEAGGNPNKVIFSGVGKTIQEMEAALDANIHCFNVESLAELDRLSAVADARGQVARISLRVNPDIDAGTHPYISTGLKENKFGVPREEAVAIYQHAQSLPGLEIIGVDCHIGSQLLSTEPFMDTLERMLSLIDDLAAKGINISHLDLGGGLGIQYLNEVAPTPAELLQRIIARCTNRNLTLAFEPGRSIIANAGVLLMKVEYLKETTGKNFAIVDAAMNDIIRPALYQSIMDIVPVRTLSGSSTKRTTAQWDLVGPICETGDFLGKNRTLSLAQGDLLAMMSAGAYCFTMSSNYNTRNRAAEVIVDGNVPHVVRRRENYSDQLALESVIEEG